MKSLLFTLLFVLSLGSISAQITEGQLSYTIEFTGTNDEMKAAASMMEGSKMKIYFSPDKVAADVNMGSMMKMKSIIDVKKDKGIILMEMMGQKIASQIESVKKKDAEIKDLGKPIATAETKKILGYNCTKFILKDNLDTTLWVTTDLKMTTAGLDQFTTNVEGVPLEFSTIDEGMSVHFTATAFDKTVDQNVFKTDIPQGYTVLTEEQMKGMGG